MLMADGEYLEPTDSEEIFEATVRFRTVGDMSCTGAFASTVATMQEVIDEVSASRITERGASGVADLPALAAMEDGSERGTSNGPRRPGPPRHHRLGR